MFWAGSDLFTVVFCLRMEARSWANFTIWFHYKNRGKMSKYYLNVDKCSSWIINHVMWRNTNYTTIGCIFNINKMIRCQLYKRTSKKINKIVNNLLDVSFARIFSKLVAVNNPYLLASCMCMHFVLKESTDICRWRVNRSCERAKGCFVSISEIIESDSGAFKRLEKTRWIDFSHLPYFLVRRLALTA